MSVSSKRYFALVDLAARLRWISIEHGYNSNAGQRVLLGEAVTFGRGDPPAALAIVVDDDSPALPQEGGVVKTTVPVRVEAWVPATLADPLLALESLIADVKVAVEIETEPSRERFLGQVVNGKLVGTLPRGLSRGHTRPIARPAGSKTVGMAIEYELQFEERWGKPGGDDDDVDQDDDT